ncbi:proline/glycine betaine ABC transporter permease, partial [Rhizobium sp. CNPSo 4039]|nr:proline/glycine betaine ABC transporter permease [Rhizobium sp. CNPSo 4039]
MNFDLLRFSPGQYFAPAVDWLNTNFHPVFETITRLIETVLGALESALLYPPAYALIIAAVLGVGLAINIRAAVVTAVALAFCLLAGLWAASMQTLA